MKITFKQLEVFIAIAKYKHMGLAAESIFLTQSACSMSLSTLERQFGLTLFDRAKKGLILNEVGRMLYPQAVNLLAKAKELENLMMNTEEKPVGHLLVGASTTIGNYVLPKIISRFSHDFPQTNITLRVNNTETIIKEILNFDIDIGFIEGNCYSLNLNIKKWKGDNLIVIAAPDHRLNQKKRLSFKDLEHAKWILREKGSGTREHFENAMKANILALMEFTHTEAINQAVMTGIGIGCVSELTVIEYLKNKSLVQLATPFLKLSREFYMLIHKEKYQTAVLNAFIQKCETAYL